MSSNNKIVKCVGLGLKYPKIKKLFLNPKDSITSILEELFYHIDIEDQINQDSFEYTFCGAHCHKNLSQSLVE